MKFLLFLFLPSLSFALLQFDLYVRNNTVVHSDLRVGGDYEVREFVYHNDEVKTFELQGNLRIELQAKFAEEDSLGEQFGPSSLIEFSYRFFLNSKPVLLNGKPQLVTVVPLGGKKSYRYQTSQNREIELALEPRLISPSKRIGKNAP